MRVYKNEGETPLECLNRLRTENPEYKDSVLSYAGRLDPMAEGELIVLVNEENQNRDEYLGMDKTYEVDLLFGIKTDTADILGKILQIQKSSFYNTKQNEEHTNTEAELLQTLTNFMGEVTMPYPMYSSKTVNGKPLFQWARELRREGKIDEIERPTKTSRIYEIKFVSKYVLNSIEILNQVINRVNKVKGDFRQKEIIDTWIHHLSDRNDQYTIYKIEVTCSTGTYMRSLAELIAVSMGTVGIAWKIKRTWLRIHK